MWNEDCVIHEMKLDEASRDAPLLHSKYLELLSHTKLKLKRAEAQQKVLLKDKWLYSNGKMSEEDLKTKGWNPDPVRTYENIPIEHANNLWITALAAGYKVAF